MFFFVTNISLKSVYKVKTTTLELGLKVRSKYLDIMILCVIQRDHINKVLP